MRPLALLAAAVALAIGFASAVCAEDDAAAKVRADLTAAAATKEPSKVSKVLDSAAALVGPGATFPDNGDLAEWLGSMPETVTSMPVVEIRRAWLYVTARRGADAIPLLTPALEAEPKNALLRAYLGEAKRQTGDVPGAVGEWARALGDGATDEQVLPSVRKLVYDLRHDGQQEPAGKLPRYATAAAPLLAIRPWPEVTEALADWLAFDAGEEKADAARATRLAAEGFRMLYAALRSPVPDGARARLARKAFDAGLARRAMKDAPDGGPTTFDLFAMAVRLGETGTEGHRIPEALTALADEAVEKGRYVLAARLCRRRLSISDSPAARRILMSLPPDVGDEAGVR